MASKSSKMPFIDGVRVSRQEIQDYLNIVVEEYRRIIKTDLPVLYGRFPLWEYPVRVIAGITRSRVYTFITRDGEPIETQVEVYDVSKRRELGEVMDAFRAHPNEVARILGISSVIYRRTDMATQNRFSDETARNRALDLVKTHYNLLEDSGRVNVEMLDATEPLHYLPPISFFENHIESSELRNKIEQMLNDAQEEIMISGWLDTSLLGILQRKSKDGVLIRIITNKYNDRSPQPVKTAYRSLVDFAQVRRNSLRHCRLVICDQNEVLVSSADLTTHSLTQNYEAGIWTSSPIVVNRSIDHFERIWNNEDTKDVNQELRGRR